MRANEVTRVTGRIADRIAGETIEELLAVARGEKLPDPHVYQRFMTRLVLSGKEGGRGAGRAATKKPWRVNPRV